MSETDTRITIITVIWNDSLEGAIDSEEWAYRLRLGGLDAVHVHIHEDVPTAYSYEEAVAATDITWEELKRRLENDD